MLNKLAVEAGEKFEFNRICLCLTKENFLPSEFLLFTSESALLHPLWEHISF